MDRDELNEFADAEMVDPFEEQRGPEPLTDAEIAVIHRHFGGDTTAIVREVERLYGIGGRA